jgi:hypothetical protein
MISLISLVRRQLRDWENAERQRREEEGEGRRGVSRWK